MNAIARGDWEPSATEVCRALREDRHPASGWLRWGLTGGVCDPREVWLADVHMWVRANGRYVTGWRGPDGDAHFFATRFGWLNAWRIRLAIGAWARRQSSLIEQLKKPVGVEEEGALTRRECGVAPVGLTVHQAFETSGKGSR